MKCMSVPANLTWEEWQRLAIRQLDQLGMTATDEVLNQLFADGLTVNEAISLVGEWGDDTEDTETQQG